MTATASSVNRAESEPRARSRPGRAHKVRWRRPRKLIRLLREPRFRRGLRYGVAATIEHINVPFCPDVASVVDVGAHHGQFALFALHRFPDAHVVCVEPLAAARSRIRSVVGADPRVTIVAGAAATQRAYRQLHVSRKSDSSSLLEITSRYTDAFPGTEETSVVNVHTASLDDLLAAAPLPPPTLLKIDVQGGELEVLRGAPNLLRKTQEILVECSFVEFYSGQALIGEVITYLESHGFSLCGAYSLVRDGDHRCLQADLLFSRRTEDHGR